MLNLTFKGQLNNLTHQIVFNGIVNVIRKKIKSILSIFDVNINYRALIFLRGKHGQNVPGHF